MMIDIEGAAALILHQHPNSTVKDALAQAHHHLADGSLAAATAWARAAARLSETEAKTPSRIVA